MASTRLASILKASPQFMLAALAICAGGSSALAQNMFDKGTPAESKAGVASVSGYAPDKIETVNLANGNLAVQIPLVTVGGRGSASFTVALAHNSKVWAGQHDTEQIPDPPSTLHHHSATYDDLVGKTPNRIGLGGGWFISKAPALKVKRIFMQPINLGGGNSTFKYVLSKVSLVLQDGSEVELRDTKTQGAPWLRQLSPTAPSDRDRGRVWVSTDGSAITYVTDEENGVVKALGANSSSPPNPAFLNGWVYLADGTRLQMGGVPSEGNARCTRIYDPNGNFITINYNIPGRAVSYTDQLGREVFVTAGMGQGATITIVGYGGTPTRTITVSTGLILDNLRADAAALPQPIFNGDFANGEHTQPLPHTDLFDGSDDFSRIDVGEAFVVTRLTLLDGRRFQFRYNEFGELAEIVYPGGGISRTEYASFGSTMCEGGVVQSQLNRGVSQRRTLSNGVAVDATWSYIRGTGSVGATSFPTERVQVHQGDGTGGLLLMDETHYFLERDANYRISCSPFGGSDGTGYEKFENAKEFRVERKTGPTTQTVEDLAWQQRTGVVWANDPGSSVNQFAVEHGQEQPSNDPRVMRRDDILENGKLKRAAFSYDDFNNVVSIRDYGFGQGVQGTLLRETTRTYVGTGGATLNGLCYTNLDGLASCSSTSIGAAKSIIHRRRLLQRETIANSVTGMIEAFTDYEYDNYLADGGNHAAVQANPFMIQYDGTWLTQFFTPQHQPRGNVTAVKRLISGSPPPAPGIFTDEYSQYDEAGNVVKVLVPNGSITNTTTTSYSDNFGSGTDPDTIGSAPNGATFSLPTLVTNALGHQARTQYDYTRGVVSGVRDANLTRTKTDYDLYDRPVMVTAGVGLSGPENMVTEMSYPGVDLSGLPVNESKVSKQLDDTRWLTSRTQTDGFGRVVLTSQTEDGRRFSDPLISYTIHSKTIYDGLGRTVKSSNPFRSTGAANTDGWTRSAYNLSGRVIDVATFSGDSNTPPPDFPQTNGFWTGSVVTTYNGEVTTVRDQANKQRRSSVDALGRLITVEEMNEHPATSVYATTNYAYDARGNLLTVTQAQGPTTQTRRFAYDLLSRLIFAANPEQNTSGDPLLTHDSQQWAVRYDYDLASNLTTKTDTRLVSGSAPFVAISYQYDALNRAKKHTYNDGTPLVTYVYDTATKGVGRLRSVTASQVSTYNYLSYDALGRPTAYNQVTEGQTYSMSCTYNKAGLPADETYPSGKVMRTEYDNAGRPAGVKKTTNSFYYAGGASGDSTNRAQYSAHGDVTVMKLGSGLWEHTNFNSRLQPIQIGLGINQTSLSIVGLDYTYNTTGAADNNGNIRTQTITVPSVPSTPYNTFTQIYTYDQANRLASARENLGPKWMWTQTYGYDRWGNRTSLANTGPKAQLLPTQTTPTVDPNTNRINAGAFRYDKAGNLEITPGEELTYDAENRLIKYSSSCHFSYDGEGRRVIKLAADTKVFVYNATGQLVAEYFSSTGNLPNLKVSYLTADHLGSTRVVTDQNQNLVARHDYMPFGEEIPVLVSGRANSIGYTVDDGIRQRFTSKERDSESGLDYFIARYYSSAHGRFTSPDEFTGGPDELFDFAEDASDNPTFYAELHEPQSLNKYQYCYNNPLNYVDPDGHGIKDWVKSAAKTAGEFAGGVARGVAASMSYGTAPHSGPSSDDSIASRLGQAVGSAVVIVGGTQTTSAGVAVSGTGVGAVVGVPVAVAGVAAVVGGAVNASKVVTTPINTKNTNTPQSSTEPRPGSVEATGQKGGLGGSGKPREHFVQHSTTKGAKQTGGGRHDQPHRARTSRGQREHFHGTGGNRRVHHTVGPAKNRLRPGEKQRKRE